MSMAVCPCDRIAAEPGMVAEDAMPHHFAITVRRTTDHPAEHPGDRWGSAVVRRAVLVRL